MKPSEIFARRVKEVRTRKGLTQQQLADSLIGIGRSALLRIESNERQVTIDDLVQITAVLGPSPVHMLIPVDGDELVEIADVALSPREAREWFRGHMPLRQEDASTYFTEVAAEELRRHYDLTLSLLMNLAQGVVEAVTESAGDLTPEARNGIADRVDALNRELDRVQKGKGRGTSS